MNVSSHLLIAFSVIEAVLLVAVLAVALIQVRRRLQTIGTGLGVLAELVGSVEGDLRLIAPTVPQVNAPLRDIVGALPQIAAMAETLADGH
jgi:hypothetical protein